VQPLEWRAIGHGNSDVRHYVAFLPPASSKYEVKYRPPRTPTTYPADSVLVSTAVRRMPHWSEPQQRLFPASRCATRHRRAWCGQQTRAATLLRNARSAQRRCARMLRSRSSPAPTVPFSSRFLSQYTEENHADDPPSGGPCPASTGTDLRHAIPSRGPRRRRHGVDARCSVDRALPRSPSDVDVRGREPWRCAVR
jgi:hypothetical protein